MNTVVISGNVVSDVDSPRSVGGDSQVVDIRVAVRGRGKDDTAFVDVTLWNKLAETAAKYLGKGKFVIIEGRLQQDEWQDKETGAKRSKIKVVANGMDLGPKLVDSDDATAKSKGTSKSANLPVDDDDEDIPF